MWLRGSKSAFNFENMKNSARKRAKKQAMGLQQMMDASERLRLYHDAEALREPARKSTPRPLVFLDFDDVICINSVYGGYDVLAPNPPADIWEKLFHPPAVQTLLTIIEVHQPWVVITTSWLRFMDRPAVETILSRAGLAPVAAALHPLAWDAEQLHGTTRFDAIARWLEKHHQGEPLVVLDDEASGTGLRGSKLYKAGRVVLCEVGVGLHIGHLAAVAKALKS